MSPQVPELVLTDPEAANALSQAAFLGHFREPASPSEVARQLDMPANLAHHHVQKFVRLGLLFEVGRDRGRVLYQLRALTFKVPAEVSGAARRLDTMFERSLRQLTEDLLEACERSSGLKANPGPWTICHFGQEAEPMPSRPVPESPEARPAHFVGRTLRLTPERYRELVAHLDRLVCEQESQDEPGAARCTVGILAFEGDRGEGRTESLTATGFLKLGGEGR